MYYEINVSEQQHDRNGVTTIVLGKPVYAHFFATAERSLQSQREMVAVLKVFKEKFPKPQYKLSVTYWETRGEELDVDTLLAE